ncbi:hypothetical protein KDL44_09015 [bacterium]|nr:hypothetical protein [bacterium]
MSALSIPERRIRRIWIACLLVLACGCATLMLCFSRVAAQEGEAGPQLFVALDEAGKLLPMQVEERPFDARLDFSSGAEPATDQPWQWNIYAQFYFPGEDPQIDYTFLGNRRYPRLLLKLDRKAALIWVSTAGTRADAEDYARDLRRQGLEGAFVARARGDYAHKHSPSEETLLAGLAAQLDPQQCKGRPALEWLAEQDRRRRFAMQVRLVYVEGLSGVDQALAARDAVKQAIGDCGMLNRPAGGYRLFCGSYLDRQSALQAYKSVEAATGLQPRVICMNADGVETRWMEEDFSSK